MAEPPTLQQNLEGWLASEGYPLEYFSAEVFSSVGFDVLQGTYARSQEGRPREIDLVAQRMIDVDGSFIRIENVVECKWSGDKPWVVFTSPRSQMMDSACIAQSISSYVGDALLWTLAGHEGLQALRLFKSVEAPGFGGRQAFGKADLFYDALAAVTSACVAIIRNIDDRSPDISDLPRPCVITFPVVVVDGKLFEADYDASGDKMCITEVDQIRCHWLGAPAWPLRATVDIVTRNGLQSFATNRWQDVEAALPILAERLRNLQQAYREEEFQKLSFNPAPTGRGRAPRLLRRLRQHQSQCVGSAG